MRTRARQAENRSSIGGIPVENETPVDTRIEVSTVRRAGSI